MYKYFLGIRFLLFRPINLFGVGGVTLAVWALILIVAIFSGFIREVRSHIRGASSDLVLHGVRPDLITEEFTYPKVEAVLKQNPAVAHCSPRIILPALIFKDSLRNYSGTSQYSQNNFVTVMGIDPRKEERSTDFRSFLNNPKVSMLDRVSDPDHPFTLPPEHHSATGKQRPGLLVSRAKFLEKGERFSLATVNLFDQDINFNPEEENGSSFLIKQDMQVSGIYESKYNEHDMVFVYAHIDQVRTMLGNDPLEDGFLQDYSEIAIRIKGNPSEGELLAIKADLEERLMAMSPYGFTPRGGMKTWFQRKANFLKAVDHERSLMAIVLCIILCVALFLILATLSMMVTEKTRDIGILAALGATRTGVLWIFLFCGFVISFMGATLGCLSGWISALYLNDFNDFLKANFGLELFPRTIYNLTEIPTQLDPVWMASVFVGAIITALLFALIPAWRASNFEPVRALRYE